MYDRMQTFTDEELTKIHDGALHILKNIGARFDDDEAIDIFKKAGFKVDGSIVRFTEKAIDEALASAPSEFVLSARNAEKSVVIGNDDPIPRQTKEYLFLIIMHVSGLTGAPRFNYDHTEC